MPRVWVRLGSRVCEPAGAAAGGAGAPKNFWRGRYRCASSGGGAFGWERRVQRVPASGPALSHPRLGGAVAHAWRPGRTRPKDGHWAKRPLRAGYARPAHDFCTRGQHLDACAGVKIWALPRTCIRRSRGCNIAAELRGSCDVVWPDSDSGVLAAGMALRGPQNARRGNSDASIFKIPAR